MGTGTNTADQDETSPRGGLTFDDREVTSPKAKAKSSKGLLSLKLLWNIATERFDRLLECNEIWRTFMAENTAPDHETNDSHRRFIRINPDLQYKVPRLNEVKELGRLEKATSEYLNQNLARTKEIAHRLIASTFFFDKNPSSVKQRNPNQFECEGKPPRAWPLSPQIPAPKLTHFPNPTHRQNPLPLRAKLR